MQIEKQDIVMRKALYDATITTEAEGSIIVPDIKSDILKVLGVDAKTYICDKQITDGKVTISGKVMINVLYMPEGENSPCETINACFDFSETLKRSEFLQDMDLLCVPENQKVTYRVINSRKISVCAKIEIGVSVIAESNSSVVCDVLDDECFTKKDIIEISGIGGVYDFDFAIEENLELAGCGNKILNYSAQIGDKEFKVLDGKVVLKGKLNVTVLYLNTQNKCASAEYEIPYTEVFEIESLTENTECEFFYQVGDMSLALSEQNENTETFCFLSKVYVCVKTTIKKEMGVLTDLYFKNADCKEEKEEICTENFVPCINFSTIIKEMVEKGEGRPEIASVYQVLAKPRITESTSDGNKVSVSGKVLISVLYMTKAEDCPIATSEQEISFNYLINADCSDEVVLDILCEHTSYTLASENTIEVRLGIRILGKSVKKRNCVLIKDLEVLPCHKPESAAVIYFVKKNDTIWDVAKHYKINADVIRQYNSLGEDCRLCEGKRLIIPIN